MKFFSTSYLITPLRLCLILTFSCCSLQLWALGQPQVLGCLAKEETRLHQNKKTTSPLYALNQNFVNRIVLGDFPRLTPETVTTLCKSASPSLTLLQEILGKREEAFNDKKENIHEAIREVFPYLQSYLLNIQNKLGADENLAETIPELKIFHLRFQNLQGQVDDTLITSQKLIYNILLKLQNPDFKKLQ